MDLLLRNAFTCNVSFFVLALLLVSIFQAADEKAVLSFSSASHKTGDDVRKLISQQWSGCRCCLYHSAQRLEASIHRTVMAVKDLERESGFSECFQS